MGCQDSNRRHPDACDRLRLSRLSEEISTRAGELARIVARVTDQRPTGPLVSYRFKARSDPSSDIVVKTHQVTWSDGTVGCHDADAAISCAGPCPCA